MKMAKSLPSTFEQPSIYENSLSTIEAELQVDDTTLTSGEFECGCSAEPIVVASSDIDIERHMWSIDSPQKVSTDIHIQSVQEAGYPSLAASHCVPYTTEIPQLNPHTHKGRAVETRSICSDISNVENTSDSGGDTATDCDNRKTEVAYSCVVPNSARCSEIPTVVHEFDTTEDTIPIIDYDSDITGKVISWVLPNFVYSLYTTGETNSRIITTVNRDDSDTTESTTVSEFTCCHDSDSTEETTDFKEFTCDSDTTEFARVSEFIGSCYSERRKERQRALLTIKLKLQQFWSCNSATTPEPIDSGVDCYFDSIEEERPQVSLSQLILVPDSNFWTGIPIIVIHQNISLHNNCWHLLDSYREQFGRDRSEGIYRERHPSGLGITIYCPVPGILEKLRLNDVINQRDLEPTVDHCGFDFKTFTLFILLVIALLCDRIKEQLCATLNLRRGLQTHRETEFF